MHYIPVAPPPPQTTAIFRDFKKSTAMCKVHNVGLWYIKNPYSLYKNLLGCILTKAFYSQQQENVCPI
jgi:hypothetical protein